MFPDCFNFAGCRPLPPYLPPQICRTRNSYQFLLIQLARLVYQVAGRATVGNFVPALSPDCAPDLQNKKCLSISADSISPVSVSEGQPGRRWEFPDRFNCAGFCRPRSAEPQIASCILLIQLARFVYLMAVLGGGAKFCPSNAFRQFQLCRFRPPPPLSAARGLQNQKCLTNSADSIRPVTASSGWPGRRRQILSQYCFPTVSIVPPAPFCAALCCRPLPPPSGLPSATPFCGPSSADPEMPINFC